MRWFAFSLMLLCGAMVGCEAPKEKIEVETVMDEADVSIASPSVDSASSAVTGESEPAASEEAIAPPIPGEAAVTEPAVSEPAVTEPTPTIEPAPAAEPKPDSASAKGGEAVRFVATKSVKVPTMMCPYSCWPKVKETLEAMPGVEGVQLAAQAKETEIDNPVVELKTTADFNVEAAIAALDKASFADAVVVK